MIYFYNFRLLPALYMSTPALGVLCSRCFVGATSYLANINSFAGLRLLLNQNDKALSFLTLGIMNESDIPSSSIFTANVNERNRYAEACG